MATQNVRFWLMLVTLVEALGAFFAGVFFAVWGEELTSRPWEIIMSMPGGGHTLGAVLLCSGALFLMGLDWHRLWPRVVACATVGLTYIAVGVVLTWVSFTTPNTALNGSMGAWLILGVITLCLAGFMWSERRLEINERRQYDRSRR